MSLVTDVVVVAGYVTKTIEEALVEPMAFDEPRHQRLAKIDMNYAGGAKAFQSDVFAAGLNYVSGEELEAWFKSLPWSEYDDAVLVWTTEGDRHGKVVIGDVVAKNWEDR